MSVRESFVARFGEEQAAAIERAAEGHKNGVHDNPGSDLFKWACLIAIGYECMTRYAPHHGIAVDPEDFKAWAKADGEFATHDGDFDYIALLTGKYVEYLPEGTVVEAEP